jgi:hypothetical protein
MRQNLAEMEQIVRELSQLQHKLTHLESRLQDVKEQDELTRLAQLWDDNVSSRHGTKAA